MRKLMNDDLVKEGEAEPLDAGSEDELLTMSLMSLNEPTKSVALINYDLDSFNNSIWENFMGSMVEYKKLVSPNG